MKYKLCPKCKKTKQETEFYKTSSKGLYCHCKSCHSIDCRLSYQKNIIKRKLTRKKYIERNKERINKRNAEYHIKQYKNNLKEFVSRMYRLMRMRVNNNVKFPAYKGIVLCDRQEFIDFALNNNQLKKLFLDWQKHNYDRHFTPTPDRIINKQGYAIDNIQFLTLTDNCIKANAERKINNAH